MKRLRGNKWEEVVTDEWGTIFIKKQSPEEASKNDEFYEIPEGYAKISIKGRTTYVDMSKFGSPKRKIEGDENMNKENITNEEVAAATALIAEAQIAETSAEETPAGETSAEEPAAAVPATQTPAEEVAAAAALISEAQIAENSIEETPAGETSAEETAAAVPATQTPVAEIPAEEIEHEEPVIEGEIKDSVDQNQKGDSDGSHLRVVDLTKRNKIIKNAAICCAIAVVAGTLIAGAAYHSVNRDKDEPAVNPIEQTNPDHTPVDPVEVLPAFSTQEDIAQFEALLTEKMGAEILHYELQGNKDDKTLVVCGENENSIVFYERDFEVKEINDLNQAKDLKKAINIINDKGIVNIITLSKKENLFEYDGYKYNLSAIKGENPFNVDAGANTVTSVLSIEVLQDSRNSSTGWTGKVVYVSQDNGTTTLVKKSFDCAQKTTEADIIKGIASPEAKTVAVGLINKDYSPRLNPVEREKMSVTVDSNYNYDANEQLRKQAEIMAISKGIIANNEKLVEILTTDSRSISALKVQGSRAQDYLCVVRFDEQGEVISSDRFMAIEAYGSYNTESLDTLHYMLTDDFSGKYGSEGKTIYVKSNVGEYNNIYGGSLDTVSVQYYEDKQPEVLYNANVISATSAKELKTVNLVNALLNKIQNKKPNIAGSVQFNFEKGSDQYDAIEQSLPGWYDLVGYEPVDIEKTK